MATEFAMNGDGADSQLMNYLVRMVVPMRREFAVSDVGAFVRLFRFFRRARFRFVQTHTPPSHACPFWHARPQPPQLLEELFGSTQPASHGASGATQPAAPPRRRRPRPATTGMTTTAPAATRPVRPP